MTSLSSASDTLTKQFIRANLNHVIQIQEMGSLVSWSLLQKTTSKKLNFYLNHEFYIIEPTPFQTLYISWQSRMCSLPRDPWKEVPG